MASRERGWIASWYSDEDYDRMWVRIGLGDDPEHPSSVQGFGGILMGEDTDMRSDFVASLCRTFGVGRLEELIGREVYALRCWEASSSDIEGLECARTGRRFLLTPWIRRHVPDAPTPLQKRTQHLMDRHAGLLREVATTMQDLTIALTGYVDWSREDSDAPTLWDRLKVDDPG